MAQAKNVAQGAWVSVIDARPISTAKLRVAAYARVSSDSDDQINSYIAQVDYYTKYIASKEEWEMVDVYADEGLTGMEASLSDFERLHPLVFYPQNETVSGFLDTEWEKQYGVSLPALASAMGFSIARC